MAATTDEPPSVPFSEVIEDDNPWRSAAEPLLGSNGTPSPFATSRSDIPETPTFSGTQSGNNTPYYTPATTGPSRPDRSSIFLRTPSGPADPETPTKSSRTASPPKADSALRHPHTPVRSARNSIARLTPAPLLTPLSNSLSAVVADELRRGEGSSRSTRQRSRRRRGSQARRQSLIDDDGLLRQQTNESEPESDHADVVRDAPVAKKKKKGRLRSVSDALGELIGGKSKRRKRDEEDSGGGAGGSTIT